MSRKTILFVHHALAKGGAAISLATLIRYLDRSRFKPIVLNCRCDPLVRELYEKEDAEVVDIPISYFPHTSLGEWSLGKKGHLLKMLKFLFGLSARRRKIEKLADEVHADIVHLNSLTLAPYLTRTLQKNRPTILHVREPVADGLMGLRKQWFRNRIVRHATHTIAICEDNLQRLNLPAQRTSMIFNPVDLDRFSPAISKTRAREALGVPINAFVVLFAGGSDPFIKGLLDFLDVMLQIDQDKGELHILLPSISDTMMQSQAIKERLDKLSAGTTNAPFTFEIEQWMAAADVVYALHKKPHFSRTLIEAGAMALPVIGYDVSGVNEVVEDHHTGFLCQQGDIAAVSDVTSLLRADPALRSRLGEESLKRVKSLYDARNYARKVESIYDRCLASILA